MTHSKEVLTESLKTFKRIIVLAKVARLAEHNLFDQLSDYKDDSRIFDLIFREVNDIYSKVDLFLGRIDSKDFVFEEKILNDVVDRVCEISVLCEIFISHKKNLYEQNDDWKENFHTPEAIFEATEEINGLLNWELFYDLNDRLKKIFKVELIDAEAECHKNEAEKLELIDTNN
ncbi:MAG TPA: hypothetical protein DHV28_13645 [Ignavibacteriales bacterium]|nr:hypothetical protein [Ignavibacteriales bacterium]